MFVPKPAQEYWVSHLIMQPKICNRWLNVHKIIGLQEQISFVLAIDLITVFDAILMARQSGQELQCLYGNQMANNFVQNWILTQLVNRNVKTLGGRLCSPSLKDAAWPEDAQLIFLIFHTFVCKFGWVDAVRGKKITDKCMEN